MIPKLMHQEPISVSLFISKALTSTTKNYNFFFIEHVWEVQVHRRGLAVEKNIVGSYHLCLTDKALRLSATGSRVNLIGEPRMPFVEFLLTTIRR